MTDNQYDANRHRWNVRKDLLFAWAKLFPILSQVDNIGLCDDEYHYFVIEGSLGQVSLTHNGVSVVLHWDCWAASITDDNENRQFVLDAIGTWRVVQAECDGLGISVSPRL